MLMSDATIVLHLGMALDDAWGAPLVGQTDSLKAALCRWQRSRPRMEFRQAHESRPSSAADSIHRQVEP
eukprot:1601815-Pleurochrysis_carterae.AAC.5